MQNKLYAYVFWLSYLIFFQVMQKIKKKIGLLDKTEACRDNVTFHYVRADNLKYIIVFISRISH